MAVGSDAEQDPVAVHRLMQGATHAETASETAALCSHSGFDIHGYVTSRRVLLRIWHLFLDGFALLGVSQLFLKSGRLFSMNARGPSLESSIAARGLWIAAASSTASWCPIP